MLTKYRSIEDFTVQMCIFTLCCALTVTMLRAQLRRWLWATPILKRSAYSTARRVMSKSLHQIFAMRERTAPKHRSTQTQPQRCKPLTRLCFQAKLWKPATAPFRFAPASLKALCKAQTKAEFQLHQAEPCL